jgi:hypothetical protein
MDKLAEPRDPDKFKNLNAASGGGGENIYAKEESLARKLQDKKKIEFGDYIDRDIPPIQGDGEFS